MMKIVVLGSGTSTGVPMVGCRCKVCTSKNQKNKRLRASVWVQTKGKSFLLDTSTDLRQQALSHRLNRIDAILYTHPHADHVSGIDEIRCWNFIQKAPIPAYGNDWTSSELRSRFPYIFSPGPVEGGGIPQLELHTISGETPSVSICGVPVTPVSLQHGSKECLGFRFDSFAYVTDCSYIPPKSLHRLEALKVLILDCVRIKAHRTHLNLDGALEIARQLKARRTILTHMGHDFDYTYWSKRLPRGVELAYDGMTIGIRDSVKKDSVK